MSKFLVLCGFFLCFLSCSIENNNLEYTIEQLPVENVKIPKTFKYNETYSISISYYKPYSCYAFKELLFENNKENNIYTIAPLMFAFKTKCDPLNKLLEETTFDFKVTSKDPYTFKFWKGKTTEDNFLIINVPVIE